MGTQEGDSESGHAGPDDLLHHVEVGHIPSVREIVVAVKVEITNVAAKLKVAVAQRAYQVDVVEFLIFRLGNADRYRAFQREGVRMEAQLLYNGKSVLIGGTQHHRAVQKALHRGCRHRQQRPLRPCRPDSENPNPNSQPLDRAARSHSFPVSHSAGRFGLLPVAAQNLQPGCRRCKVPACRSRSPSPDNSPDR